jgi:hypothetical protein
VNGNGSGKNKEKSKSIKMRLIPGKVASNWGQPISPEVGELEEVIYCSEQSLRRVRRRLNQEGEGMIYVRIKKSEQNPGDVVTKEEEVTDGSKENEEQGLEGWLAVWDEVPDGCCVVAGAAKEDWSVRGSIR